MIWLTNIWQRLSKYGISHYQNTQERKANIISNQLLLLTLGSIMWLGILEITGYIYLASLDYNTYFIYLFFYGIPSTFMFIAIVVIYVVKNKYGLADISIFTTFIVMTYITMICIYVGPTPRVHIFLFAMLPLPFFVFGFKKTKFIIISEIATITCIGFAFYFYAFHEPLFPLPEKLAYFFQYIAIIMLLFIMIFTSYYMWNQTHKTELKLAEEKKVSEELLSIVIPKHQKAEKKYRHLVEGTNDIIFSLDEKFNFLTVNKSISKLLGHKPDDVINTNFLNLLYATEDDKSGISKNYVKQQLDYILKNEKSQTFIITMTKKYSNEPIELNAVIEFSKTEEQIELLGKITYMKDDTLAKYFESEKKCYHFDNLLNNAEIISQELAKRLKIFINETDATAMRICLRENIINAIEHGNLDISFDQKTKLQMEDRYFEFIKDRQSDPKYANRLVRIDYVLNKEKVAFRISDEGNGFDHKKFINADKINEQMVSHGRGIMMTKSLFDEIEYNDKGNQVTLVKFF